MTNSNRFFGFRFNSNNGFDHLARAIANGAVADNVRTVNPLPAGATVVVLAKVGSEYLAVSGVTTGEFLSVSPQSVWPAWDTGTNTKVHQVVFKTQICKVPSALAVQCDTTSIRECDAADLAYHCFANG
jgi:hypothetical protein